MFCKVPLAICSLAYFDNGNIVEINTSRNRDNFSLTNGHEMIGNLWKSAYDSSRFTVAVTKCIETSFFKDIVRFKRELCAKTIS